MDYEVQRCTRQCATSGRDLAPGEEFYSVLVAAGAELIRRDYAVEAWEGPPEGAVAWWKSQMPNPQATKMRLAPNEVLLQLFDQLEEQPDKRDMRYVLALLLVRRRVMRLEGSERDAEGRELLVLYCPRRDATYQVPEETPNDERANQIQEELAQLLYARAT
jgi:hypothetical protein